ncbi:MAG: DNA polymerase III subunit gamma/tau [Candidatus Omnitrophica bacterium]|nr:DNA polymerase III subunit gamma/tau [Candidatus Omnitrophota bacterium]
MPYTVFALKWRPKNFDEIIGQPQISTSLKSAIQQNKLANAYLFAGPRGVGKTSTARILAKSLNCKEGLSANPCSKCSSCLEIAEGRSLDVMEIDGASNRGIDEIRTLRENVKFAPVSGKFKVYIIDEVHQITADGFNALLKTLEEPPPYVKFIFATTHPNKVLPTILSRCQRFDFRRISVMEIASQLERIVKSEKIDVDKEVLLTIARSSDGSLRDAESVLDQLASFSKGKISLNDVISVLGLVEQEALFSLTDKMIQRDPRGALDLLNQIIDEGKDIGVLLNNLIEHFRNLMIAKVTKADAKLIDLPQEICEKLLKQSEALSLEEIFSAFNILVATQDMSKRLDSLRIPLEISLVRLAHNKKSPPGAVHQAAPQTVHKPAHQSTIQPVKPPVEAKAAPVKADPKEAPKKEADPPVNIKITLDDIRASWSKVINSISTVKMSIATYLNEGEATELRGNILTIAFPKTYSLHKESLEEKDNRVLVEKAFFDLFNADLRLNFALSLEQSKRQQAEGSDFIKSALEAFNGRVLKHD